MRSRGGSASSAETAAGRHQRRHPAARSSRCAMILQGTCRRRDHGRRPRRRSPRSRSAKQTERSRKCAGWRMTGSERGGMVSMLVIRRGRASLADAQCARCSRVCRPQTHWCAEAGARRPRAGSSRGQATSLREDAQSAGRHTARDICAPGGRGNGSSHRTGTNSGRAHRCERRRQRLLVGAPEDDARP